MVTEIFYRNNGFYFLQKETKISGKINQKLMAKVKYACTWKWVNDSETSLNMCF